MMWWCKCVPIEECRFISTPDCAASEVSVYTFTVSGLANDDCSSCNDWNGTFNLEYMSPGIWESPSSASTNCNHVSGDPLWRLDTYSIGSTRYYRLSAVGLGYAWRLVSTSWVCGGDNVLTKVAAVIFPNPCLNLPTTISLTPCLRVCPYCIEDTDTGTGTGTGDVVPDSLAVTLSGMTAFFESTCSWCASSLNTTFILDRVRNCQWVTTGTAECGGCPIEYSIAAYVSAGNYGPTDVSWQVVVVIRTPVGSCVGLPSEGPVQETHEFHWRSGGISAIDCTMTRTLSYRRSYGTPMYFSEYGIWMDATVCEAFYATAQVN